MEKKEFALKHESQITLTSPYTFRACVQIYADLGRLISILYL